MSGEKESSKDKNSNLFKDSYKEETFTLGNKSEKNHHNSGDNLVRFKGTNFTL
jgi:hypothetical protein